MDAVHIRHVTLEDLDACCQIESACFTVAEAASRVSIETRIKVFPQGFLVAEYKGKVIGQINSGATDQDDLADEALKQLIGHVPNGKNLVIFSLSVLPPYQRRGIGGRLLTRFVDRARDDGRAAILLLCRSHFISYYLGFGFTDRCVSASTHGGKWR